MNGPEPGLERLSRVLSELPLDRAQTMLEALSGRLNAASVDLLERQLGERQQIGVRTDPYSLARHLDGDAVRPWRYSQYLADRFRAAVTLESRLQCWSLPAQVGKSTWLRRGVVWALDRNPSASLLYMTHSDTLARESALFVRDQSRTHADKLRYDLKPDVQRQDRWMTTDGGGLLATYVGGGSGFSANDGGGVIVDDPLRNWQAAHSPTERAAKWNEIRAVARLRLSMGAFFVMAHTRWHLDDPTGMMMRLAEELGLDIEFVRIPMICDSDDDPLGRQLGEPLEPERYSLDECRARAAFLGSYLTAAMEQQNPVPEEGGEVKREWWRWTSTPPARFDDVLSSWDMKLKDKESGDFVVGLIVGRVGARFWIVDMIRGQFSQLQTKVAIALMALRHPSVHKHIIENTGNGPEVMTELRSGDPAFELTDELADKVGVHADERADVERIIRRGLTGIIGHSPKESKLVRARRITPSIEGGNVTLIENKQWSAALVDEWAGFPPKRGGHDDIVDATTQGIDRLGKRSAKATPAPSTPTPTAPAGARSTGAPSGGATARILR